LLYVPERIVLVCRLLEITLTVAGRYLLPMLPAPALKKGAKVPEILLPGFPIGSRQVGVLLQMPEKLLENDIIFLAFSCFLAYYLRFFTKLFGNNKPSYLIDKNYIFYSIIFISAVVIISLAFRLYFWDIIYKKNYYFKVIIFIETS